MVTRGDVRVVARKVARPVWRPVDGFERKGLAAVAGNRPPPRPALISCLRDETRDQCAGTVAVLVQRPVTADGSELARPSGDSELLVWWRSVDECEGQRAATFDADDARAVRQPGRLDENTAADLVADRRSALRQLVVKDDDVGAEGPGCPRSV